VRVCVLSDENIEDFDPSPFLAGFDWEMITLTAPVAEKVQALAESGRFDLFLNLCEGYELDGEARDGSEYEGMEVVKALERTEMPFTGSDSRSWDPTREEQQAAAEKHGVSFAKGFRVRSVDEAMELVQHLRYPIMVKHPQSYASTGMFKESRANTLEEVKRQVARICSAYGAARMEEFIVGHEYNVLVVDNADDLDRPFAYPPAELIFPPGEDFWHTDVKWNYEAPFSFREATDPLLTARLQDAGRRMFLAMGMAGCGRCDIRLSEAGEPIVVEINANPGIMFPPEEYGPSDYMILYDPGGYAVFFDRLFRAAIVRHRLRNQ
jgi:D-alanine-D-alanine ligase